MTTATFKAADLSNLSAANIKGGVVLAGVTGDYPSVTNPLASADATTDLPTFASTTGGATYEWFKSDGTRVTGTIQADESVTPTAAAQTLDAGLYRSVSVAGDADFVANNMKNAVTIFGVTGNVVPSASNCVSDGELGCVTKASYKAADMTNVIAGNIKDTIVIAGVTGNLSGTPANCSANAQVGCVTTATYKAADLTNLLAGNIKNGVSLAGVSGTYPSLVTPLQGATGTSDLISMGPTATAGSYEFFDSVGTRYTGAIADAGAITPGTSLQTFNASLYRQFTVAGDADLVAANISNGIQILAVTGTTIPSPANCAADGVTGCVTTATYKSANTGAYAGSDIKSGKTIGGVAGTLANCAADAATGCVTTASFKAADVSVATPANIKSGVTIAGAIGAYPSATYPLAGNTAATDLPNLAATVAAGSYEWFKSDGSLASGSIADAATVTPGASSQTFNSSVYRQFTVAGDADLVAGNIKNAIVLFGVTGNVVAESHADCTGNAQTGCVTTATYKSGDLTNLTAASIKSSVTIAGVAGNYPSTTYPLAGADATTDLPTFASTAGGTTYEWFQSNGTRISAAVQANPTVTPSASAQTLNTGLYRSITVDGDADLVAGNIKSEASVFGVTGGYPSATYPLTGADATADLDLATFDAKLKAATAFEWFSPSGNRYSNTGDTDLAAANIKSGTSIFGTSGTYGPNCTSDGQVGCLSTSVYKAANTNNYTTWDIRKGKTVGGKAGDLTLFKNMANIATFNRTGGSGSHEGIDYYDTIDDYNNNGAMPTQNNAFWDPFSGSNWVMDSVNDNGAGGGTSGNGSCEGTEACIFTDKISDTMWAKDNGSENSFESAISLCDGLSYGGYSDWRLPTIKELMQANIDGIWSLKASNKLNLTSAQYYMSGSSRSSNSAQAWVADVYLGSSTTSDKVTNPYKHVLCVRAAKDLVQTTCASGANCSYTCAPGKNCVVDNVDEGFAINTGCSGGSTMLNVDARYGYNCAAVPTCAPNNTACSGNASCSATFSNAVCGDTASGCVKKGRIAFTCSQ